MNTLFSSTSVAIGLVAVALLCRTTLASDSEEGQSGEFLPEIVVVASPTSPQDAKNTSRWRVSGEDMAALNAVTIGEALRVQPGLNVQYGASSAEARAWIRGFRDRDVLVLFDGVPVSSAFEGTLDLDELPADFVREIRVSKAAPSVIYGANGVGGVIDILPGSWSEAQRSVRLEVGPRQTHLLRASSPFNLKTASGLASIGHFSSDGFSVADSSGDGSATGAHDRVNSDFERTDLMLSVGSESLLSGVSSLSYLGSRAQKGLPPGVGPDDPDFERLNQSDRDTVIVSHNFDGAPVAIKAFINRYRYRLDGYTDSRYTEVAESEEGKDSSMGARLYGTYSTTGGDELIGSLSVTREAFESSVAYADSTKESADTWNAAAEYYGFFEGAGIRWRAGAIYTHFAGSRGGSVTALNPQVALDKDILPTTSVTLSAAQRTRFPKLKELYDRKYGNEDLKDLQSNSWELRLRHALTPNSDFSFSLFRHEIDGLIDKPARRSPYANLDDTRIDGVEASLMVSGGANTLLSVGGALSRAEETTAEGKRQLRSRPRYSAFFDFRTAAGPFSLLALRGEYINGLHDISDDGTYSKLDSYFVISGKASWQMSDAIELYAAAANIADDYYQQKLGFPRPGRELKLGVTLTF